MSPEKNDQVRVLFLAANPKKTVELDLEEEYNRVYEALNRSPNAGSFRLYRYWRVRRDELIDLLNDYRPHILHFSGHGDDNGKLLLEDAKHNVWPIDDSTLREVVQVAKHNLRLAVLNACYSHLAGQVLSRTLDCVVGMSAAVFDASAVTFATAFYRALGDGISVQQAFDQARAQIRVAEQAGTHTPQILSGPRADDPRAIYPLKWLEINKDNGGLRLGPGLSSAEVRGLLKKHLVTDQDFMAFIVNEFTDLARQYFSTGMDRITKTNLLLQREEPDIITAKLETYLSDPDNPGRR